MKLIAFLVISVFLAAPALGPVFAAPEDERVDAELADLHHDIMLLNLVNGLYLNEGQTAKLIETLRRAEESREEFVEGMKEILPEMKAAYAALRADLLDDDVVDPRVEERAGRVHGREVALKNEFEETIVRLEKEVNGILTEKQLALVEDFRPCLIPPKTDGGSRVGQAGSANSRTEGMLKEMRSIPDWRFDSAVGRMIDRYIERLEREKGVLTDEERSRERRAVSNLIYEAREMTDMEFEMRKATLAERLEASFRGGGKERKRKGEAGKAGRFLLDERLLPLLERKAYSSLGAGGAE